MRHSFHRRPAALRQRPLDLNDNTGEQNSLCDAIGFFNPVWDSKEDQDSCFFKAVAVAKQILENQIDSANAVNRADEKVQQAYRNSRDGIVVLPCYLPWKNGLYKTDALFVVSSLPVKCTKSSVQKAFPEMTAKCVS